MKYITLLALFAVLSPVRAETEAERAMRIANGIANNDQPAQMSAVEISSYIKNAQAGGLAEARNIASTLQIQLDSSARKKDVFGAEVGEPASINGANSDVALEQRKNAAAECIKSLQIVGVSPERNEFYVGAWIMHAGDSITLVHDSQVFSFNVESILPDTVTFRENDSGSKIVARINIIPSDAPPEMTPITR